MSKDFSNLVASIAERDPAFDEDEDPQTVLFDVLNDRLDELTHAEAKREQLRQRMGINSSDSETLDSTDSKWNEKQEALLTRIRGDN